MSLLEQLMSFGIFQWIGLVSGILYVIYAALNQSICWVFGIISCLSIFYIDVFTSVALYSDALLQMVYIIVGFYGLRQWFIKKSNDSQESRIVSKGLVWHLKYILLFSILAIPFGKAMSYFFGAEFPLLDAWTTILSIWATVLLARRIIENWIFWIVLDAIYVFLYYYRDATLFSLLFIIYSIVSIYGYYRWYVLKQENII